MKTMESVLINDCNVGNFIKAFKWAWFDTRCRYRRSKIGPLWETLSTLVLISGITFISSSVMGGTFRGEIVYVGSGIIVWSIISFAFINGSSAFISGSEIIKTTNLPIFLLVSKCTANILISFGHNSILYVIGLLLLDIHFGYNIVLIFLGIIIVFLNVQWVVFICALLSARFRDFEMIVKSLIQLAFFATPVFWDYELLPPEKAYVIDFNVFFYFIEIIRLPVLNQIPPLHFYFITLTVTILGLLISLPVYRKYRSRVAFFV